MVRISNVSYAYTNDKKILFPDFEVEAGKSCLLLGNSGSGKTTLLHLLGGLLTSQQGKIVINQAELNTLSETKLDRFRGKNLGFIFQKNHLIPALTVKQNLLMAPFLARISQDESRAEQVLTQLDLLDKKNPNVKQLSQGQAQRVAIARAILNKPAVILADEPTSALDDKNCERVIALLLDVAQQNNSTLIVATHDQRLKDKISMSIQLN